MALRHMRIWQYVEEVARAGSMRKAAERLNVTASALQRRIHDIEEDLGAKIFERAARGIKTTAEGEIFIAWIREQSAGLDRACSQIDDLSKLKRGQVRIACSQALAYSFLPKEIANFRKIHPLVTFQLGVYSHATATRALIELETDLSLVVRPGPTRELQQLASVPQPVVAIMRASHVLAKQRSVSLSDCARFPIAMFDRSFGARQIVDRVLLRQNMQFNIVLEANSSEALKRFVCNCDAITFQIEIGSPIYEADRRVIGRPISDVNLERPPLILSKLRGRTLPIGSSTFAKFLAGRLRSRQV